MSASALTRQQTIQKRVDQANKKARAAKEKEKKANGAAPQTGMRAYPTPPLPEQHHAKPGVESKIDPAPLYDAPYYKGSGKLEGKVALITGGDSGIGRSVAVLFAREGARVAIAYLSEESDAKATRSAVEGEGQACLLLKGDVGDPAFCQEIAATVMKEFGAIDVLVNNAAFQQHVERLEDLENDHFDMTLKTNLYGYFHMVKACLPYLKAGAAIINTGSVTGIRGSKNLLDYSMTKGGIHAFTRALAGHLIERGIRVNAVAPGPVWTPLNPAEQSPEDIAQFGAKTPMKRPAQPEEIAPAYVFLASAACASYITGEVLPIIGGY